MPGRRHHRRNLPQPPGLQVFGDEFELGHDHAHPMQRGAVGHAGTLEGPALVAGHHRHVGRHAPGLPVVMPAQRMDDRVIVQPRHVDWPQGGRGNRAERGGEHRLEHELGLFVGPPGRGDIGVAAIARGVVAGIEKHSGYRNIGVPAAKIGQPRRQPLRSK